jgi:hypothetical protein
LCRQTFNDPEEGSFQFDAAAIKRPNVKHQRARATASWAKGAISLRALRCMR